VVEESTQKYILNMMRQKQIDFTTATMNEVMSEHDIVSLLKMASDEYMTCDIALAIDH